MSSHSHFQPQDHKESTIQHIVSTHKIHLPTLTKSGIFLLSPWSRFLMKIRWAAMWAKSIHTLSKCGGQSHYFITTHQASWCIGCATMLIHPFLLLVSLWIVTHTEYHCLFQPNVSNSTACSNLSTEFHHFFPAIEVEQSWVFATTGGLQIKRVEEEKTVEEKKKPWLSICHVSNSICTVATI